MERIRAEVPAECLRLPLCAQCAQLAGRATRKLHERVADPLPAFRGRRCAVTRLSTHSRLIHSLSLADCGTGEYCNIVRCALTWPLLVTPLYRTRTGVLYSSQYSYQNSECRDRPIATFRRTCQATQPETKRRPPRSTDDRQRRRSSVGPGRSRAENRRGLALAACSAVVRVVCKLETRELAAGTARRRHQREAAARRVGCDVCR